MGYVRRFWYSRGRLLESIARGFVLAVDVQKQLGYHSLLCFHSLGEGRDKHRNGGVRWSVVISHLGSRSGNHIRAIMALPHRAIVRMQRVVVEEVTRVMVIEAEESPIQTTSALLVMARDPEVRFCSYQYEPNPRQKKPLVTSYAFNGIWSPSLIERAGQDAGGWLRIPKMANLGTALEQAR